ncbi:MAG: hypothetical protein GQ544_08770 [Candidatus Aminicenantes bacterium]|nr:hypothetical protein [Candidatus Aminicenantes bacterium]
MRNSDSAKKKTGESPEIFVCRKIKTTKDRNKRFKIIKALSRVNKPWVGEVLINSLDESCEDIREYLIKELGQRKDLDLELVYPKLKALTWYVKSSCLKILGMRKNPGAIPEISRILKDPNADVRATAAWALGEIGGKEALATLSGLTKDENNFVRISGEKALHKASHLKFI